MKESEQDLEDRLKSDGYNYLGWANGCLTEHYVADDGVKYFRYIDQPEYQSCVDKEHNDWRNSDHYESVQHTKSGSRVTYYCDHCKIYWKVDMS